MEKNVIIFLGLTVLNIFGKEYPKPIRGYYSQNGQDKFLNEKLFNRKRSGFFVDIGAHDGISFSNTYFFEKYLCWTGICVEPNPDIFSKLIQNRSTICLPVGIAGKNGKRKYLKCSGYMLEMYSGILDSYDTRMRQRIKDEIKQFGGNKDIIAIDCRTLEDIFNEYQVNHVDLLSIDIEGGEVEAIKSINFSKVTIDIIVVENNFNEETIKNYLLMHGYQFIRRIGKDDVYIKQ